MIRLPQTAIMTMATALVLLLAAEWLLPGPGAQPSAQTLAISDTGADNIGDGSIGQRGDTVLARPLFNPGRHPVTQNVAAPGYSLPRLSAIFIVDGVGSAAFSSDGQKSQLVMQGAALGSYQVKTIFPDRVELLGPNGLVTLRPQFAAASPTNSGP